MNKKKLFKGFAGFCAGLMMFTPAAYLVHAEADDKTQDQAEASAASDNTGSDAAKTDAADVQKSDDTIVLRVSNWEEYIDLGEWDEDEVIDLEDGTEIFGENSMVTDFENWYYETYGQKVKVEYSCFGTNEDLYNMLTLGDKYDLVCPSDYMIMKLMAEEKVVPFSDSFYDTSIEENYYAKGVSQW